VRLNSMKKDRLNLWAALVLFLAMSWQAVFAQGTAFTYQGRLNGGGAAANGSFDLQFSLYDTNLNANLLAGPVTNSG
jgi:hypothetical protein